MRACRHCPLLTAFLRRDQHRTNIACDALNRTAEPFRFFLVHLTNVDTQAHYYGVQSPRYNHDDTYNRAVTHTAGYLRQLLKVMHPDTILVVTADHGEVDAGRACAAHCPLLTFFIAGGHGGIAPILRQIPFVVYKKGSNIGAAESQSGGQTEKGAGRQPFIEDVAPTIMALLDLPVPRQSTGAILPIAWSLVPGAQRRKSLQDLYEARRELVNVFALQGRYTAREWCSDLAELLVRNHTWARTATEDELEAGVAELDRVYAQLRSDMLAPLMARNLVLTAMLCAVVLLYLVRGLRAPPTLIFCDRWCWPSGTPC